MWVQEKDRGVSYIDRCLVQHEMITAYLFVPHRDAGYPDSFYIIKIRNIVLAFNSRRYIHVTNSQIGVMVSLLVLKINKYEVFNYSYCSFNELECK